MKVLEQLQISKKTGGINMAEKQRILIVDDDYNIAELISTLPDERMF